MKKPYYLNADSNLFVILQTKNDLCMKNFDNYRRWFNQLFSLSFDGKFKGLSIIVRLYGERFFEHFVYKLHKILNRPAGYRARLDSDVIVFRLSGHIVKLYNR